ncbi:MAG: hypothetical protein R3B70_32985 [Polyangiaceae bacterium]
MSPSGATADPKPGRCPPHRTARILNVCVLAGVFPWLILGAACAPVDPPDPDPPPEGGTTIDIRRAGSTVLVRRAEGDREVLSMDVTLDGGRVLLTARAAPAAEEEGGAAADLDVTIDAVATGPGVAITATAGASAGGGEAAVLDIQNDLVLEGGVAQRLYEPAERDAVVERVAQGALGAAFERLAPYRAAVLGHLAEAGPVFEVVGLFQAWPDGEEPAWPALDDPRDIDPPGHIEGDVIGIGMTCSSSIRCPSFAPFCVTESHEVEYGVCTRACAVDADCAVPAGVGRCSMAVTDIPDVPGSVLACRVECDGGECPGILQCQPESLMCGAPEVP